VSNANASPAGTIKEKTARQMAISNLLIKLRYTLRLKRRNGASEESYYLWGMNKQLVIVKCERCTARQGNWLK